MKAIYTLLFLFLLPGFNQAEARTFKMATTAPTGSIWMKEIQKAATIIEKRTDGRVVVEHYPGQTLTKARQCYDGVVTGLSDLGLSVFAYTRGRFPVMAAVDLPLGYTSGSVATAVANAVYQKFKPKELLDTQVMYLHAHGPGLLHTKGKLVRKLEDVKGLKIRGHGTSVLPPRSLP